MEIIFDPPEGLIISEEVPPYPQKRRRMKNKWTETAPTLSYDSDTLPRVVCLSPDMTVTDVSEAAVDPLRIYTCVPFTPEEWLDKSGCLRNLARQHVMYPIVVRGDQSRSKRCPHAALRRLEHIMDWQWQVISAHGVEQGHIIVDRQIRHGKSRLRTRKWGATSPPVRRVYTLPPTDLDAVMAHPSFSVDDALEIGGRRTLRIYDVYGGEMWLLPASTLTLLTVTKLSSAAASSEDAPFV